MNLKIFEIGSIWKRKQSTSIESFNSKYWKVVMVPEKRSLKRIKNKMDIYWHNCLILEAVDENSFQKRATPFVDNFLHEYEYYCSREEWEFDNKVKSLLKQIGY